MRTPLVLVVEDNPTQQKLFRILLKRAGYDYHVVSSCMELFDALSLSSAYELVIMDWRSLIAKMGSLVYVKYETVKRELTNTYRWWYL